MRRLRQRRQLVNQLVDANPMFAKLNQPNPGDWLWQALRWGGPALMIGWWLAQAAKG